MDVDIGLLIEQLAIANVKLFQLCNKKVDAAAGKLSAAAMQQLAADDLDLCKLRARLRGEINKALGSHGDSVKSYG